MSVHHADHPSIPWVRSVRLALQVTRREVDWVGAGMLDLASYETAAEGVGRALERASATVGLDTELGWKLLDLRDVLTSHLVAAHAVADIGRGEDSAGLLLRRGVDEVAARLDEILASAGSSS